MRKAGMGVAQISEWETADPEAVARGQAAGVQGLAEKRDRTKILARARELMAEHSQTRHYRTKRRSFKHLSLDEVLLPTIEIQERRRTRPTRDHEIEEDSSEVPDILEEFLGYAEYGWEAAPEEDE